VSALHTLPSGSGAVHVPLLVAGPVAGVQVEPALQTAQPALV
jgi:hypothetical protein